MQILISFSFIVIIQLVVWVHLFDWLTFFFLDLLKVLMDQIEMPLGKYTKEKDTVHN